MSWWHTVASTALAVVLGCGGRSDLAAAHDAGTAPPGCPCGLTFACTSTDGVAAADGTVTFASGSGTCLVSNAPANADYDFGMMCQASGTLTINGVGTWQLEGSTLSLAAAWCIEGPWGSSCQGEESVSYACTEM
jgi:hypothetical protein